VERFYPEDKDGYEKEQFDIVPRKNYYYYKYEIAKYARQGPAGLKRALELFREMKSVARLAPQCENFSPLFYGCAKAGYTRRAFELYEELLKYERKPTNSSITCLIDSCAECPFPEYGLKRLEWFLTELKVRFNHDLNLAQCNAAVKAYGKLGRLDEAAKFVKKMIDEGMHPDLCTFKSLLIGCASDKTSGTTLALRVFKRLKVVDMKPDTITYRLLLRCVRDCGLGDEQLIQETLDDLPAMTSFEQRLKYNQRSSKGAKKLRGNFVSTQTMTELGESLVNALTEPKQRQPTTGERNDALQKYNTREKHTNSNISEVKRRIQKSSIIDAERKQHCDNTSVSISHESIKPPNLLSDDHMDLLSRIEALRIDHLRTRYDRILLFGGLEGIIEEMLRDGCKPDMKTLSLLLACIKPTKENFLQFFELCKTLKVERDVDFYDHMIYYVSRDFQNKDRLQLALEFLERLHQDNLRPTINTFEALALACNKWKEAKQLIVDMKCSNLVVSRTMFDGFFNSAISRRNYHFLTKLLQLSLANNFKPSKTCIERLEALRLKTHALLVKQERGAIQSVISEEYVRQYDEFCKALKPFMKHIELREESHPWEQFSVPTESKKHEFLKFAKHMNLMYKLKMDTLEKGARLGNVPAMASKLIEEESIKQP